MTTDPRQCPKCKRMIEPALVDGVAVLKAHGTWTLGRGLKMCPAGLKPIREKRTRLGHQIQKGLRDRSPIALDVDRIHIEKQCGRCGKGEAAGAAGLCRECFETPTGCLFCGDEGHDQPDCPIAHPVYRAR